MRLLNLFQIIITHFLNYCYKVRISIRGDSKRGREVTLVLFKIMTESPGSDVKEICMNDKDMDGALWDNCLGPAWDNYSYRLTGLRYLCTNPKQNQTKPWSQVFSRIILHSLSTPTNATC